MACLIWSYSLYDVSVEYQGWCVLQVTLQVVIDKAVSSGQHYCPCCAEFIAAHRSPTAVAGPDISAIEAQPAYSSRCRESGICSATVMMMTNAES